jgi:transcriptional regulator with XRE-family HTH domain
LATVVMTSDDPRQILKHIRRQRGLTQATVGQKMRHQKSRSAIAMYETGKNEIPLQALRDLAEVLDVSLTTLLGEQSVELHT